MGQITMGTDLGKFIYKTCLSDSKIKTVVDIGTWDGRGSTECAIEGLKNSGREDITLVSFETNKQFYDNESCMKIHINYAHGRTRSRTRTRPHARERQESLAPIYQ